MTKPTWGEILASADVRAELAGAIKALIPKEIDFIFIMGNAKTLEVKPIIIDIPKDVAVAMLHAVADAIQGSTGVSDTERN